MYKNVVISLSIIFLCVNRFVAQDIRVFDSFDKMEEKIFLKNDTTYVINFWATWCKPCVKELPYFEKFHKSIQGKNIKVILVSLDFRNQIDTKLKPFIETGKYTCNVVLLLDNKYNSWIEKVNKDWSGSIPATLLINGDKRYFEEREFENEKEINDFVLEFIKSR